MPFPERGGVECGGWREREIDSGVFFHEAFTFVIQMRRVLRGEEATTGGSKLGHVETSAIQLSQSYVIPLALSTVDLYSSRGNGFEWHRSAGADIDYPLCSLPYFVDGTHNGPPRPVPSICGDCLSFCVQTSQSSSSSPQTCRVCGSVNIWLFATVTLIFSVRTSSSSKPN